MPTTFTPELPEGRAKAGEAGQFASQIVKMMGKSNLRRQGDCYINVVRVILKHFWRFLLQFFIYRGQIFGHVGLSQPMLWVCGDLILILATTLLWQHLQAI